MTRTKLQGIYSSRSSKNAPLLAAVASKEKAARRCPNGREARPAARQKGRSWRAGRDAKLLRVGGLTKEDAPAIGGSVFQLGDVKGTVANVGRASGGSKGPVDFAQTEIEITKLMGKGEAAARRELMELHGDSVEVDV